MYSPGGTLAICDRCGFEYPLRKLKKEWTGLMVCPADFDPPPAELRPPRVKAEGLPKLNARPDNQTGEYDPATDWLVTLAASGAQPTVMTTDPTFTAGIANAAATLAGTTYAWTDTTRFNLMGGTWAVAGAVYPDNEFGRTRSATYSADGVSYASLVNCAEFIHIGDALEFYLKGTGPVCRLLVNGQSTTASFPSTPNDGNLYWHKVDFGSVATRTLRIEQYHASEMRFGGCRIKTGQTITATSHAYRLVLAGDSFTEGTGATNNPGAGLAPYIARELGFSDFVVSGSGGTGWINPGSRIIMGARLDLDVIANAPDMVVFLMGLNDTGDIKATVEASLGRIRQALPYCLIHIFGPFDINAPTAMDVNAAARQANIRDAAEWRDRCWYHSLEGVSFTKADATHPDQAGHVTLGKAIYNKIAAVHGLHTVS